jgi:hypothetical protein
MKYLQLVMEMPKVAQALMLLNIQPLDRSELSMKAEEPKERWCFQRSLRLIHFQKWQHRANLIVFIQHTPQHDKFNITRCGVDATGDPS